ncbi:AMP-binding protein [Nonomuraea angiospora]|uniref:AMP-binding protein n=1 Tax=Nonomuraea angiospora TaxID=46172 RepID=UPI00344F5725
MRGFYEIAAHEPERPALLGDTGATYGELLARVNQVSNGLTAHGVAPGDRVVTVDSFPHTGSFCCSMYCSSTVSGGPPTDPAK